MTTVSAATIAQGVAERLRDDALGNGGYARRLQLEIARLNLQGENAVAAVLSSTYLPTALAGTHTRANGVA